jgi:hypothetical protein
MILDAQNMFSSAQALPNNTAAASTNVIDLGIAGRSLQLPDESLLLLWTGTPIGTSIRIDLRSGATAADLTSSPTVHWSSGVVPQADYAAQNIATGKYTLIKLPWPTDQYSLSGGGSIDAVGAYKRFLGLYFTTVGDASAGVLTAGLVRDADMQHYPASGYTLAAMA